MQITLENAIFDDLYVTSDTTTDYITTAPTEWDEDTTLLWAQLNGDLIGGNVEEVVRKILAQIKAVRIKKRKVDDFEWTTIAEYKVDNSYQINFSFDDVTGVNDTEYEYAWIPVLKNGSEGQYVTSTIMSKFNGIILADKNFTYRFYANAKYGSVSRRQQVGAYEPYGRKYPIMVTNAETSYEQGSFSGQILGATYNVTGEFIQGAQMAKEIVADKKILMAFLTNKQAKILKDAQGNIWLIYIVDTPTVNYDDKTGNTMAQISFNWTEIGDATVTQDLVNAGLVGGRL